MQHEEPTYTTAEAARLLQKGNRRVLRMLETGELEAEKDGAGRWRIPQRAVHDLLHGEDRVLASSVGTLDAAREVAELRETARGLERELGRMEGRLELTALAEDTLREQLRRERERADRLEAERERLIPDLLRERDRTKAERERAEHFEAKLREALESRRGWFRRFFGF